MSVKITNISARQILDSRGNPTIEVTVYAGKQFALASVPSGASTGSHEAYELRDGGKSYNGLSVQKACRNASVVIKKLLLNQNIFDQQKIDELMIKKDNSVNKSNLGANAILGVSLATARLASKLSNLELYEYLAKTYKLPRSYSVPTPLFNIINGGKHADSGTDIQEFFIIPKRGNFVHKIETVWRVVNSLKSILRQKKLSVAIGDEGGFAPKIHSNEKALRLIHLVCRNERLRIGQDVGLGIDAAASEFYDKQKEVYNLSADYKHYKPASIYRLYSRWQKKFGIEIVEDGCAEDDYHGWYKLTALLGNQLLLVGDDLFVTNQSRLHTGIISNIANSILIKPNQIGTLTETMQTIQLAKKYKYQVVISHRSGETNDDFIADLAVAVSADYIKAGSLVRGERVAKYNRLLKIAEDLKQ